VRIYARDPYLADQLVANYRQADVSDRRLVMLDVAVKLTERPDEVTAADLELLREAGYDTAEIWDIGAVTAFFNLSNRMAIFATGGPTRSSTRWVGERPAVETEAVGDRRLAVPSSVRRTSGKYLRRTGPRTRNG